MSKIVEEKSWKLGLLYWLATPQGQYTSRKKLETIKRMVKLAGDRHVIAAVAAAHSFYLIVENDNEDTADRIIAVVKAGEHLALGYTTLDYDEDPYEEFLAPAMGWDIAPATGPDLTPDQLI